MPLCRVPLRMTGLLSFTALLLSACAASPASAPTSVPASVASPSTQGLPAALSPSAGSSASAVTTASGSAGVGSPALGSVDSCSAVTQSEAGAALGQTVSAPVRGHATVEGGVACVFYGPTAPPSANPDVPAPDSVRVVLVTGSDAGSFFNDYRSKVPAQGVDGLGDQAYYDGSASLSVLKGAAYLRVAVIGVSDVLTAEKMLAAAALPRM